ncbi:MAG TPA: MYXO-CTERM sorting domain-containing protein, partial [Myxococcales bacterium]
DGFVPAGTACRVAAGDCDLAESCTGSSASCPVDGFAPAGTACRVAAGDCDLAESCSGSSASCPVDGFVPAGTACRVAAGDCDLAESCSGAAKDCPPDSFLASGTLCRNGACADGMAMPASSCDGSGDCPATTPISCGDYACATNECRTDCTGPSDCAPGRACISSRCVVTDAGFAVLDGSVPEDSGTIGEDVGAIGDAAVVDGGGENPADAGPPPDGALADAGGVVVADAEVVSEEDGGGSDPDSGSLSQADAAAARDDLGSPVTVESGCGCGATRSGSSLPALVVVALLGLAFGGRRRGQQVRR